MKKSLKSKAAATQAARKPQKGKELYMKEGDQKQIHDCETWEAINIKIRELAYADALMKCAKAPSIASVNYVLRRRLLMELARIRPNDKRGIDFNIELTMTYHELYLKGVPKDILDGVFAQLSTNGIDITRDDSEEEAFVQQATEEVLKAASNAERLKEKDTMRDFHSSMNAWIMMSNAMADLSPNASNEQIITALFCTIEYEIAAGAAAEKTALKADRSAIMEKAIANLVNAGIPEEKITLASMEHNAKLAERKAATLNASSKMEEILAVVSVFKLAYPDDGIAYRKMLAALVKRGIPEGKIRQAADLVDRNNMLDWIARS